MRKPKTPDKLDFIKGFWLSTLWVGFVELFGGIDIVKRLDELLRRIIRYSNYHKKVLILKWLTDVAVGIIKKTE